MSGMELGQLLRESLADVQPNGQSVTVAAVTVTYRGEVVEVPKGSSIFFSPTGSKPARKYNDAVIFIGTDGDFLRILPGAAGNVRIVRARISSRR